MAPAKKGGDVADDSASVGADGGATKEENKDQTTDEEVPVTFPQRLMEILGTEENQDMIRWLPHGKGFIIADKKRFAAEVLPKYFSRKSKFTSFTRKLNRWNFTRVTRGPEVGAYYHPLFQKDDMRLCLQMTCIHSKSPQQLQPMNPIALGLGMPNMMPWGPPADPNDPAAMQRMAEQRQQYIQYFQQQQYMAMQAMQQQQEGKDGEKKEGDEGKMDEQQQQAMVAFQQQQWQMMMAQQQQWQAAMAAQQQPKGDEVKMEGEKEEDDDKIEEETDEKAKDTASV